MSIERMVLVFADFCPMSEVLKAVGKKTAARPSNIRRLENCRSDESKKKYNSPLFPPIDSLLFFPTSLVGT
jgi:hypothetical protein